MSQFKIYITSAALWEIENLPGNLRQRVRREIGSLGAEPHPPHSKRLQLPDFPREMWRVRIDRWRIIYVITPDESIIDIVAIRKRPPYDYGDLDRLLEALK
jgi:mRNA interferase RelE/StbE